MANRSIQPGVFTGEEGGFRVHNYVSCYAAYLISLKMTARNIRWPDTRWHYSKDQNEPPTLVKDALKSTGFDRNQQELIMIRWNLLAIINIRIIEEVSLHWWTLLETFWNWQTFGNTSLRWRGRKETGWFWWSSLWWWWGAGVRERENFSAKVR